MKRWSLKVKVGAYAAMLIVLCLGVTAAVILPLVHLHLLSEVDESLENNAQELIRDVRNFPGARGPSRPLSSDKFVPPSLRRHHLLLRGAGGVVMYRSPSLGDSDLPDMVGVRNMEILGEACRVGVFREPPYTVSVAASLSPMKRTEEKLRWGFVVALPVVGVVVFLGGIWLGRRAVAPVADLTRAAERISTERPDERLPMPEAQDEIARLTEVLNESFDRMRNAYESARRFSADASHQLKTPLSLLRIGLDEMQRGAGSQTEREEVEHLLNQVRRLTGLIEDLLLLAQVDAGRLKLDFDEVDLSPLVNGAADDLEVLTESEDVDVGRQVEEALRIKGDRRRLALVLQNLVENAAKYTEPGGRIAVSAMRENGLVHVRVANSGATIAPEDQRDIFERFHRGSRVGENVRGHGLGLNIARELARVQGGDLILVSSVDGWTEFELLLPTS